MFYVVNLKYYEEYSENEKEVNLFCYGEEYCDVINTVSEYYGEDNIIEITTSIFSPDKFLMFDSPEDDQLFTDVKNRLGEVVIW